MSQNVNVNLTPGGYPKEFHVSQYDVGRQLVAKVVDSTGDYSIPSGATVVLVGTKPSGFGFTLNGTVSGSTVTFSTTATVTAEYGRIPCEIRITNGSTILGTANCMLVVEMSPHPEGTTDGNSETVIPELTLLVQRVEAAAESIHDLSVSATTLAAGSDATANYDAEENSINFGIPRGADGEVSQAELDAAVSDLKSDVNQKAAKVELSTGYELTDTNIIVGYLAGDGSVRTDIQRGCFTDMLSHTALKTVIVDTTMNKYRTAIYDENGTYISTYYGTDLDHATFAKARVFIVPIRTNGNSNATDEEINSILRSTYIISRNILETVYSPKLEVELKVDKNGENQVKSSNIDGSGFADITEGIEVGFAWYAANGPSIASAGSQSGTDRAVLDLSRYSGKLKFGFNPSLPIYGNGMNIFLIGETTEVGTARLGYYSTTTIMNNSSGFFDTSFVESGNYVIADLDAIKEAYPTANGIFINEPHSVWRLGVLAKKRLEWLEVNGCIPALVVSADGNGDYATISEALSVASNGDTIYIKDGEYKETVVINKYVHLVGQSKQGVVLYQDIGDYNNCPLLITQGSVCNMTIKSLAPADASGLTDYAYAIHLDKNFASLAKYQKCEIYNCDIYSEVNDAIGAGTNYASEYDIHDCYLHVSHNPVKNGACGFKCHNGQNQTTGKVTLKNNLIITEDANGTSCYDILFHNGGISNTQPIDVIMIGNVLKHYHNGITNIFVPSDYNFGNSVTEMNTL